MSQAVLCLTCIYTYSQWINERAFFVILREEARGEILRHHKSINLKGKMSITESHDNLDRDWQSTRGRWTEYLDETIMYVFHDRESKRKETWYSEQISSWRDSIHFHWIFFPSRVCIMFGIDLLLIGDQLSHYILLCGSCSLYLPCKRELVFLTAVYFRFSDSWFWSRQEFFSLLLLWHSLLWSCSSFRVTSRLMTLPWKCHVQTHQVACHKKLGRLSFWYWLSMSTWSSSPWLPFWMPVYFRRASSLTRLLGWHFIIHGRCIYFCVM